MPTWKRIRTADLVWNKNELDLRKMIRAGAVKEDETYLVLESDRRDNLVQVIACLERGFEEYIWFEEELYNTFPIALVQSA